MATIAANDTSNVEEDKLRSNLAILDDGSVEKRRKEEEESWKS
jgi:hypothetical protein